jgi:hypothetical protein
MSLAYQQTGRDRSLLPLTMAEENLGTSKETENKKKERRAEHLPNYASTRWTWKLTFGKPFGYAWI